MGELQHNSFSKKLFKCIVPKVGYINILLSGSTLYTEEGSKSKEVILEEDNYSDDEVHTSAKSGEEYITGITLCSEDSTGKSYGKYLRTATEFTLYNKVSNKIHNLIVSESGDDKVLYSSTYFYFPVSESIVQDYSSSVTGYKISNTFIDYELGEDSDIILTIKPYYNFSYDSNDYNPLTNNVTGSVENTYTKRVEEFEKSYGKIERITSLPANIPDSFYTEHSNISPRYLGTKRGFVDNIKLETKTSDMQEGYENKSAYSIACVHKLSGSYTPGTGSSLEPPFANFSAFSGSVFPKGTSEGALKDMSVSEIPFETLFFSSTCSNMSKTEIVISQSVEQFHRMSDPVSLGTLPNEWCTIYRMNLSGSYFQHRIVNSDIYSKDLGKVLRTNNIGIVYETASIKTRE